MPVQFSVAVRNARLDAVETTTGTAPSLRIFSGAQPADCAAADPAGLLCTIALPTDWMEAASAGSKAMLGTWQANATATGTAASWRISPTER